MKVFNKNNITSLKLLEPVQDTMLYIYVILNSDDRIKIGKTTNPLQRIKSLSGSNTGGSQICKIACLEEPTYILTLEDALHTHYNYCRIQGTEWFENLDFDEVVNFINSILSLPSYDICNKIRKQRLE